MGVPARTSRKGKRAWRRNADAADMEAALAAAAAAPIAPAKPLAALADGDLFAVDTAAAPPLARRRPRGAAALAAPLKCQLLTGAPHTRTPVPHAPPRRPKGDGVKRSVAVVAAASAAAAASRKLAARTPRALRIDPDTGLPLTRPPDAWADAAAAARVAARAARARAPRRVAPIPAVEVPAPGIAYNPAPDAHQDALAAAVAVELAKEEKAAAALAAAPPRWVERGGGQGEVDAVDELDRLLVDGATEDEEEEEREADAGPSPATPPTRPPRRKTTADRNRAARVRAAADDAAERRLLKTQAADLGRLPRLAADLARAEREAARRAARRAADAADRARRLPPKLGRRNYVEPPSAVLCSDEVPASLRALRPDAGVARDRFASLQKRGLLEPRLPVQAKKRARVAYVAGGRADRAEEGQAGVDALRKTRKKKGGGR